MFTAIKRVFLFNKKKKKNSNNIIRLKQSVVEITNQFFEFIHKNWFSLLSIIHKTSDNKIKTFLINIVIQ